MMENEANMFDGWEIISRYTRAQAIEDGVLVDVTQQFGYLGREAGFRYPIAMTATAYAATVKVWADHEQNARERLRDVLEVLRMSAKDAEGDRVHFTVKVWDGEWRTVALWSLCGPGDDAEPVLTIMLEGED